MKDFEKNGVKKGAVKMKVVAVHSREQKGSTYTISRLLLNELEKNGAEITEFAVQKTSSWETNGWI